MNPPIQMQFYIQLSEQHIVNIQLRANRPVCPSIKTAGKLDKVINKRGVKKFYKSFISAEMELINGCLCPKCYFFLSLNVAILLKSTVNNHSRRFMSSSDNHKVFIMSPSCHLLWTSQISDVKSTDDTNTVYEQKLGSSDSQEAL